MLVGYVRVSKADGSQATDFQRDALRTAGVNARHIYEDTASGKRDDRPGLAACLKRCGRRTRWSSGSWTVWAATCGTWSTRCTS